VLAYGLLREACTCITSSAVEVRGNCRDIASHKGLVESEGTRKSFAGRNMVFADLSCRMTQPAYSAAR